MSPAAGRLALNPREAAAALGVSPRTLWAMTAPRGPIPAARAGRRVLYALADLQAWLSAAAGKGGGPRIPAQAAQPVDPTPGAHGNGPGAEGGAA